MGMNAGSADAARFWQGHQGFRGELILGFMTRIATGQHIMILANGRAREVRAQ